MAFRNTTVLALALIAVVLSACSFNRAPNRAPVEDRAGSKPRPVVRPSNDTPPMAVDVENAVRPSTYTVRPGDTLNRIGFELGQRPADIARWNNLANINSLEVGQVLRVSPPASEPAVAQTKPVTSSPLLSSPSMSALPPAGVGTVTPPPSAGAATPAPAVVVEAPPVAAPPASAPPPASDEEVPWMWPTNGAVIAGFDEAKNKGLDFAGKAGDPVFAAADGRVVYAGAGLRGYGNLVILKHNNTYLTAYAHNQSLLVKEDQTVRKGQKIAEMGSTDADRVKLHFEVRRQGKPVDPSKYLPSR